MDLFQKVIERGSTRAVASQQQGFGDGGIDGKVHQSTGSLGTNYNQVNQNKIQSLVGGDGSSQTQVDPLYCCGAGSQAGGNANNQESIGQGVGQSATEPGANQNSDIVGESLSPNGSCDITQDAASNIDSAHNTARQSPCPFLLLRTSCNDDGCTAFDPVTTPPGSPASRLTKGVLNVSSGETQYTDGTLITQTGQTVEYQLTYLNGGTGTAHSVGLFDTPPAGFSFTSCTGGCEINAETGTIQWFLGDVPGDQTRTVTFRGTMVCASTRNIASGSDKEEPNGFQSGAATTSNGCVN
jgi:uncharacterized repeat protein (TIGR01451 family)